MSKCERELLRKALALANEAINKYGDAYEQDRFLDMLKRLLTLQSEAKYV